jgi:hypothetical protein
MSDASTINLMAQRRPGNHMADVLFLRYAELLVDPARRHLSTKNGSRFDAEETSCNRLNGTRHQPRRLAHG